MCFGPRRDLGLFCVLSFPLLFFFIAHYIYSLKPNTMKNFISFFCLAIFVVSGMSAALADDYGPGMDQVVSVDQPQMEVNDCFTITSAEDCSLSFVVCNDSAPIFYLSPEDGLTVNLRQDFTTISTRPINERKGIGLNRCYQVNIKQPLAVSPPSSRYSLEYFISFLSWVHDTSHAINERSRT